MRQQHEQHALFQMTSLVMKKLLPYLYAGLMIVVSGLPLSAHAQDYNLTVAVSATGDAVGSPVRDIDTRQDPLNTVGQTSSSISKDLCPADPTPGCDFSDSDLLIRTYDLIDYDFDYSLASGDDTNVTVTSTVPANFKWQFLPSFCSGAGSALSNDDRTLTCNLGDKTAGTSQTLPFRVRVLGQANGATIAIEATVGGDSGDSATSALSPTVTVTAAPRWDIRNGSSTNPTSTTFNGEIGLQQSLFFYSGTRDVWAGVEPVAGPPTLQLDVAPDVLLSYCSIGTCTQPGGKGTPVFITFTGATDLDFYLASGVGGSSTEFTTDVKGITLFISADDVVAQGGSASIGGTYTNYNPVSISGQQNYLGQGEQLSNNANARTGRVLSVGTDKRFNDLTVAAGQDLNFYLFVNNQASLVPITNVEVCDVLDTRHFSLREVSPGSAVIPSTHPSATAAVVEYANTYTAATPPADDDLYTRDETLAECNDPNTVWYPTTTAAGGVSQVTKIRVKSVDDIAAGGSFKIDIAGTVLRSGAPGGTRIGNHSALKTDETNSGAYFSGNYNILNGTGNGGSYRFGHSTTIGNSEVSITKKTDDPNTAAFPDNSISNLAPGDSLRFVLEPTLISDRDPLENADVQVVDVLPSGLDYVSATPVPTSVQTDTPSVGETTITWDFSNVVPNVALPTITLETLVSLETVNNQILTNSAVISSPEDTSTSLVNRTAERNVTVSSPGQVNVQKTVGAATILPGESLPYTLRYSNGTSSTLNTIDMIDVLPYDGDPRGSSLEGGSSLTLQDPESGLPAGVTATYSSRAPADIIENPNDPSNQGGDTKWCSSADFNTGSNCPTGFADVTAIRFVDATPYPAGDPAREISFSLNTAGNKPSNAYNNTFTLTAQGLSLPIGSSAAATTVVGVGIGGTVFEDVDNDGSFNTGNSDGVYTGVTVELFESGKVPSSDAALSSTTTDTAGTYFFDLLVPGDYFIHIPQSSIDALTGDNISSNGGSAATSASPDVDNDDDGVNSATGVQSAVITLTAGSEPTTDGVVASQTANDSMNLTLDFGFTRAPSDFGDAPDFYATLDGSGGAYHTITTGLQLGANIDAEANGFVDGVDDNGSASDDNEASGSGTGNGNDEDGLSGLPELRNTDTAYTIPANTISVQNTTATPATLHAWIDFDGDGSFETTEYSSATVGIGASNPASDLTWTGLSGIATQTTYVRLRLSSDAAITASTPGGYASDGEVEDYPLPVTVILPLPPASTSLSTCPAPASGTYGEDFQVGWFGNVNLAGKDPDLYWAQPNAAGPDAPGTGPDVDSATYFVVGPGIVHDNNGSDVEFTGVDQTSAEAALGDGDYIDYSFTTPAGLVDGRALNQFGHGNNTNTLYPFDVTILVSDSSTFATAERIAEGETITGVSPYNFKTIANTNNKNILLLPSTTYYVRAIFYNNTSGAANDKIQWDDFQLGTGLCADYPDAPDTLGVSTHAQPETPTVFLGAGLTTDVTSFNSATAVGDTDDGVTLPALTQGASATITATVAGAGGYLQGWIDWNDDGDFLDTVDGISEQISIDAQDNTTTVPGRTDDADTTAGQVSLAVTVPSSATTNQTLARFRWSTTSGLDSTTAASDGEVEDYALTITAASSLPTFSCATPIVYQTTSANSEGDLRAFDLTTNTFSTTGLAPAGFRFNAAGYREQDNYLYGFNITNSPPTLVRVGADGGVDDLGTVAGLPTGDNFNSGDVHPDGTLWVTTRTSSSLYQIDVSGATPILINTFDDVLSSTRSDVAFSADGTKLYMAKDNTDKLHEIDMTGAVPVYNSTPIAVFSNTGKWGAQWTTPTKFITYDNRTGDVHVIDLSTYAATIITTDAIYQNNDGASCRGEINFYDYGDVPTSTASYGSASHIIEAGVLLGDTVSAEASHYDSPNADGDADDGVTIPALTQGSSATITATVSGSGGYLQGWIDWNGDGDFAGGNDQIATNIQDGGAGDTDGTVDGTITLSVAVPAGATTNQTFARFRWSTTQNLDSTTTASDGEVEDYVLTITSQTGFPGIIGTVGACSVQSVTGTIMSAASTPADFNGQTTVAFAAADVGFGNRDITFTKLSGTDDAGGSSVDLYNSNAIWFGRDMFGNGKSNASTTGLDEETYEVVLDDDVTMLQLRFYAGNYNEDGDERIQVVRVEDSSGADVTASTTFQFTPSVDAQFNSATGTIEGTTYNNGSDGTLAMERTSGLRKLVFKRIEVENFQSGKVQPARNQSNGYLLEPIAYCTEEVDYSDAPTDGATSPDTAGTTSYGEATHVVTAGIQLGANITGDTNAVLDADNASDDGIAALPTLTAGATANVTIAKADITATGTGTLHAWIDFDGDGAFAAGEHTSTTVTSGTVDNDLTFSGYGTTMAGSTTFARFRFTSDTSVTAGTPTSSASDGEVEDYALTINTPSAYCSPTDLHNFNSYEVVGDGTNEFVIGDILVYEDIVSDSAGGMADLRLEVIGRTPSSAGTPGMNNDIVNMANTPAGVDSYVSFKFSIVNSGSVTTGDLIGTQATLSNATFSIKDIDSSTTNVDHSDVGGYSTVQGDQPDFLTLFDVVQGEFVNGGGPANFNVYTQTPASGSGQTANWIGAAAGGNDDHFLTLNYASLEELVILHGSTGSGQPSPNRGAIFGVCGELVLGAAKDFSDAPADGSTAPDGTASATAYGEASHTIDSGIQLGATITDETSAVLDADNASDDGIATLPILTAGDTADVTIAKADITATGTGTLHAWIDFDGDGAFAAGEYASTTVTSDTVDNDLTFSGYGTTMAAGATYARFRLTSDGALDINQNTPDGAASDGEVEDYALTVAVPVCDLDYALRWDETSGRYRVFMTPNKAPSPDFSMTGQVTIKVQTATGTDRFLPQDIQSAVANTAWSQNSRADAPAENGNADYLSFSLSAMDAGAFNWQSGVEQEVFSFANSGACLGPAQLMDNDDPFNISPNSTGTRPGNQFTNLGWGGTDDNNFCQNLELPAACSTDRGDAPVSGPAPNTTDTNAYGDAAHTIITSIYMGAAAPDADSSNQPTPDADGDDTDGINDDDGITLPALTQGVSTTITATVAGSGGYLQGWVDWNGNGVFDAVEQIATDLQDGGALDTDPGSGTIAFSVNPPGGATTNQTFARFRWSTKSGLDATTAASDGEVEDYALTVVAGSCDLDYILRWDDTNRRYRVFMKPNKDPSPDLSMTGQVTIRVPTATGADRFVVTDPQSAIANTTWVQDSRADAPTENASADYLSFSLGAPSADAFNWQANVEQEVFSFANSGACLGPAQLMDNDDPFNISPNSTGTRPGNQFTNLGWGGRDDNNFCANLELPAACTASDSDFGDAVGYGDAEHEMGGATYIGTAPDTETATRDTNADASDDNNDDGVFTDAGMTAGAQGAVMEMEDNFTLHVPVVGTGDLSAWVDWNADGDFEDTGEQIVDAMTGSDETLTVVSAVPAYATSGNTFARFRFSSDPAANSPTGRASDGEVEDYQVMLQDTPETAAAAAVPSPIASCSTTWAAGGGGHQSVTEQGITITATSSAGANSSWSFAPNDALNASGVFSDSSLNGAPSLSATYFWDTSHEDGRSAQAATDSETGTLTFTFDVPVKNPVLHLDRVGGFGGHPDATPQQLSNSAFITANAANASATFTQLAGTTHFEVTSTSIQRTPNETMVYGESSSQSGTDSTRNTAMGSVIVNGTYNSLSLDLSGVGVEGAGADGIEFVICAYPYDYGDAPASYGAANHRLPDVANVTLGGSAVDGENQPQNTANGGSDGNGDDNNGQDDEDGVRLNGTTLQDQVLANDSAVTLAITTTGNARLHGWIDWDGDGTFGNNVNELIVSEAANGSGARTITVNPPNDLTPGVSYARFRYSTDPAASNPDGTADDGEVEDYRIKLGRGFTVSGRVFKDVNVDGNNDPNEGGVTELPVVLYDTVNDTCISTRTNANGGYSFANVVPGDYQVYEASRETVPVPQNCGPANARDPGGYLSTTANASAVFTVSNTDISDIDFGDVKPPVFELDNTQTVLPNTTALHPHVFTAQSDGSVSFSIAAETADPAAINWGSQLLVDANCDGQLDGNDTAMPASISVTAGEKVCVLAKVLAPANVPAGAVHALDIQSDFTFGDGSNPLLSNGVQMHQDITRSTAGTTTAPPVDPATDPVGEPDPVSGEGKLSLVKSVWNKTSGSIFGDNDGSVALPGETLLYTIRYKNIGNGPLNELVISDSVPAFTQLDAASMSCTDTPAELLPCTVDDSLDGSLSWSWTDGDKLLSGSSGSVSYEVEVE